MQEHKVLRNPGLNPDVPTMGCHSHWAATDGKCIKCPWRLFGKTGGCLYSAAIRWGLKGLLVGKWYQELLFTLMSVSCFENKEIKTVLIRSTLPDARVASSAGYEDGQVCVRCASEEAVISPSTAPWSEDGFCSDDLLQRAMEISFCLVLFCPRRSNSNFIWLGLSNNKKVKPVKQ